MSKIQEKVVDLQVITRLAFLIAIAFQDHTVLSLDISQVVVPLRDGSNNEVTYACRPPSMDTEFLTWEGIDANGQPIPISTIISEGNLVLSVPTTTKYNGSIFTCKALQTSSSHLFTVVRIHTLFQGPLESVSNLHFIMETGINTSIHISWTAPFSLDLTTAEPDIQYCVDVYNVTGGGDLVESRCDITETFYTYTPDNPSPDHVFNFAVTPRSNVEGALNGTTSEPIQGYVIDCPFPIHSDQVTLLTNSNLDPIEFLFHSRVLGTSPGRQPTSYSIDVQSVDDSDIVNCTCPASHVTIDITVTLTMNCDTTCLIKRHRLYNMTIIAHNNAGSARSYPEMETSTHDIQNITAVIPNPGQLDITCSYLTGSTDEGFFAIVRNQLEDILYRVSKQDSLSLTGLRSGTYEPVVYDVMIDTGLPEVRPAATPQKITDVTNEDTVTAEPVSSLLSGTPQVYSTSDGRIYVSCSFLDTRIIGCVGLIHLADLGSLALTNLIVYRTDFVSSVSHNTNNITMLTHGDYTVAVFGQLVDGLETAPAIVTTVTVETPPTQTSPPHASEPTGVAVGVTVVLILNIVVVVAVVVVVVCIMKKKRSGKETIEQSSIQVNENISPVETVTLERPSTPSSTLALEDIELHSPVKLPLSPHHPPLRKDERPLLTTQDSTELFNRPPDYETGEDHLNESKRQTGIPTEDGIKLSQIKLTQHGSDTATTMTAVEETHPV